MPATQRRTNAEHGAQPLLRRNLKTCSILKGGGSSSLKGARVQGLPRPAVGQDDGEGCTAREKARMAFEAMHKGERRLDASAGRASVVSGTKVEVNGSVSVLLQLSGPETNVCASASGNLFKDVLPQRGRTMAPAGGT